MRIDATDGADIARVQMATDVGAARQGEVVLVDGFSPIGQAGMVFGDGERSTQSARDGSAGIFVSQTVVCAGRYVSSC